MYTIPFNQTTFRPLSIPGNATADKPVELELSQVGGQDLIKLKGLVYATSVLAHAHSWQKEMSAAAMDAFQQSPTFFVRGIDSISNLSVPLALAKKAQIAPIVPEGVEPPETVAIKNGTQFAAVSPYVLALAFEVAMQIAKLSSDSEIDPRFFGQGSGSPSGRTTPSGSATRARQPRKPRGTAAGATKTVN